MRFRSRLTTMEIVFPEPITETTTLQETTDPLLLTLNDVSRPPVSSVLEVPSNTTLVFEPGFSSIWEERRTTGKVDTEPIWIVLTGTGDQNDPTEVTPLVGRGQHLSFLYSCALLYFYWFTPTRDYCTEEDSQSDKRHPNN